jgi:hypothetical protein
MKISEEEIKKIINEVLSENDDFGRKVVSKSDSNKNLKQRARDALSQKGVDSVERGIIQQIENNLSRLADLTNLKSGNTFSLLKRLNAIIEKQIKRLQGEEQKDEK